MTGCRDGGKNTLDKNYLYLAERLGVRILPEVEVDGVRPDAAGYRVSVRRSTGVHRPRRVFRTRGVVFSGGVIGTVKLLLQCRQRGLLPKLSDRLGHAVRTNSEAILGVRSRKPDINFSDHIAITSGIHPDPATHIEVVRYGSGSDAMGLLTAPLTDGGGRSPRWMQFARRALHRPSELLDSLWVPGWARQTAILLVMQSADNQLRFDVRRRWWRLGGRSLNSCLAAGADRAPTYIPIAHEVVRRMAHRLDGVGEGAWPDVLFDVPTTAHILGGAVMGESPRTGVVDFSGRVFGYPDLYVADGSVVPVNLGVNPALTITALSEYILSMLPAR